MPSTRHGKQTRKINCPITVETRFVMGKESSENEKSYNKLRIQFLNRISIDN